MKNKMGKKSIKEYANVFMLGITAGYIQTIIHKTLIIF